MGCAVVVELIFGCEGIGRQLIGAVLRSDFPRVQATVFIVALMVIASNVVMDIIYDWLDPRIRFS